MKKITLSLVLLLISTVFTFATGVWTKLDLTKTGGGTISLNINKLAYEDGKLYAATGDGIWVSPSANGGDWEAFGLQGTPVYFLSFKTMKLAIVKVTASNLATATATQLYKYNGTSWVLTALNPTVLSTFGGVSNNFTQIQDGNNNTIILVPTFGGGIWRSADGGDTWTNYAQVTLPAGNIFKNVLGIYSFPGSTILYATDKVVTNDNYLLTSTDYGLTWTYNLVGDFFNPYCAFEHKVNGATYLYYGGQNGNKGLIWSSRDAGTNWQGSSTSGVPYWEVRRIIGDNDGPIYVLSSINNVYVSQLNNTTAGWDLGQDLYNETFAPVGTGITIPSTRVAPASGTYYLSDLVKSSTKLYVSAVMTDGIYVYDLTTSAINNTKASTLSLYTNATQTELIVNTEAGSTITMYSVTGKLLTSVKATDAKTLVNIKNLKASLYIVKMISTDGKLSTNRFIKN